MATDDADNIGTSENNQAAKTGKSRLPIIILSVVLVLLVVILIAVLIFQATIGRNSNNGSQTGPATNSTQVANLPTAETNGNDAANANPTPTPTKVNAGSASGTATEEAEAKETEEASAQAATNTPTIQAKATNTPKPSATPAPTDTPEVEYVNLIRNGGFEWGFSDEGTGKGWQSFNNGGAKYIFAPEVWPLAIKDGDHAQRITVYEAHQPDRYAGIYQTVPAIPGATYNLKMNGQVRSGAGDIAESQYGYRMQYAVDWSGGTDWTTIPEDEWVELPWDEQQIDSPDVEFIEYKTKLTPPGDRMTLFIRAWNKWPDPVQAQYTLDSISLVGPKPAEAMFDQPLPNTGGSSGINLPSDPVFWGSLLFLLLLVGGAIWQRKHRSHPSP